MSFGNGAMRESTLKPTITVVGVGGAGGNAVNNMISAQLEGVSFVVANTDAQALDNALTDRVIQLGTNITQGLGAGANPDVGAASAEEAAENLMEQISGSHMVFITAGMGGGTGTGAAPVVARMAKEQGILTVAVVTKPFHFEGTHRMKLAESGLEELQQYVDTMIVIPNQNLFRIANEKTTFADAFRMADEVLHSGVRGVTDLMIMPGLINLDFADIRTVMREMGKAMMGTGEAEGERRAIDAAEAAISNPLLDDVSMKGARGVLINITGGHDMTLFEVDEAANRIRDEVDPDANIIFGSTFHDNMEGSMRVSVVATGIEQSERMQRPQPSAGYSNTSENSQNMGQRSYSPRGMNDMAPKNAERYEEPAMNEAEPKSSSDSELFHFPQEQEETPVAEMPRQEPRPTQAVQQSRMGRHSPTRAEIASQDRPSAPSLPNHKAQQKTSAASSSQQHHTPHHHAATASSPQPYEDEWHDEDDQPGLLKRMASRITQAKEEMHTPAQPPQPSRRVEVARSNPQPAQNSGENLEIPAFLRRQAN